MAEETNTFAGLCALETIIIPGVFSVSLVSPETKKFELGNTIYFEHYFQYPDGSPVEPGSPLYEIYNIKGVKIASGGLKKRVEGFWYFFWTPDTLGDFLLIIKGYIEGNPIKVVRKIKIIKTTA